MLHEIGRVRQDSRRGMRRWFQDGYFDLYVWQDDQGEPIAFQLCYDRQHAEGAIGWVRGESYTHARVDHARKAAGPPASPILRASPPPPYFRVYQRFLESSRDWPEAALREFVLRHLQAYRWQLYGRRRPTRRPGRPR